MSGALAERLRRPGLILAAAFALEAAAVWLALRGQLALAAAVHALCALAATAACHAQTPSEHKRAGVVLSGLVTLTLPPLGLLTALAAWRSAAEAPAEGVLDDLYAELHGGPPEAERIEVGDARAAFLDAVDLEPYADALRYGDLDLRRGAIERLQHSGGPERIPILRRALRDPDDEIRALALSALAAIEEQLNRAVVAATQEVRARPESAEAHAALGDRLGEFCYLRLADASDRSHYHSLAFRCYARAIELSQDAARDAELITSLGRMLLRLGHAESARDAFDLAVRSARSDPRPLLWRAEAHLALGALELVERDCKLVLKLEPGTVVREAASFWVPGAETQPPTDFRPTLRRRRERLAEAPAPEAEIRPEEVQQVLQSIGRLPWEVAAEQEDLREALAELLPRLSDMDPAQRGRAFDELLAYTSDEAAVIVSELCRRGDPQVRGLWARYLGRLGNVTAIRELVGLLDDKDPAVREEARLTLGGLGPAPIEQVELLLESLQSDSPRARAFAAEALGRGRVERAVLPLIDCLDDPDHAVRLAVVEALRLANDPRAARPLGALLRDPDEEVRYRAAHTLGALEGEPPPRGLVEVLRGDESPRVRVVAAWSLANLAGRRAISPLTESLRDDPDPRVRVESCRRLGKLGGRSCVGPLLRAHAEDPDHSVRLAASFALDLIPAEVSLRPLDTASRDDNPQIRFSATTKLGDLHESSLAEGVLLKVLERDRDSIVRAGAAASLGRLGSPQVLPALEAALADGDEAVAYAATVAFMVLLLPEGLGALERHLAREIPLSSLQRQALLRFARNMAEGTALPPRVLNLAVEGLEHQDGNIRYLSAHVLGAAREQSAPDRLLECAAREPFGDARAAMEEATARILQHDPILLLSRLEAAAEEEGPEQVDSLRATLRALSHLSCRREAIPEAFGRVLTLRRRLIALGVLPREQVAYLSFFAQAPRALVDSLTRDHSVEVLVSAAKAITELALIGVRAFGDLQPLRDLIDHPSEVLQAEALAAAGALGDAEMFRTLVHLSLQSGHERDAPARTARSAVRALARGGSNA